MKRLFQRKPPNGGLDQAIACFAFLKNQSSPRADSVVSDLEMMLSEGGILNGIDLVESDSAGFSVVLNGHVPVMCRWLPGVFPQEHVPDRSAKNIAVLDGHRNQMWIGSPTMRLKPTVERQVLGALGVTFVAQAVGVAGGATGFYWVKPDQFVTLPESTLRCRDFIHQDTLPVRSWIQFVGIHVEDVVYAASFGLDSFGHRDIEIVESRRDIQGTELILENAILDTLSNGDIAKRGREWTDRTIGAQFAAGVIKSGFERGGKVTALQEKPG